MTCGPAMEAQCGFPGFTKGITGLRPFGFLIRVKMRGLGGIGVGILMTTSKGSLGEKGPLIVLWTFIA